MEMKIDFLSISSRLKWTPRAKSSKLVVHRCKRNEYYIKWNCVVLTQAKKEEHITFCPAEFSADYYLPLACVRAFMVSHMQSWKHRPANDFHLMANTLAPLWSGGVWSLRAHTHAHQPASSDSVRFDAFHTLQIIREIHFLYTKMLPSFRSYIFFLLLGTHMALKSYNTNERQLNGDGRQTTANKNTTTNACTASYVICGTRTSNNK